MQNPIFEVQTQDPPDLRREAHATEGLVDNLPTQRVEDVPYVQAHDHPPTASVSRVYESPVKRAQIVIDGLSPSETKLPLG